MKKNYGELQKVLKRTLAPVLCRLDKLGSDGLKEHSWLMTGSERLESKKDEARRRGLKNTAVCAAACLAVIVLYAMLAGPPEGCESLTRPEYGSGSGMVTLAAKVEDGGSTYSEICSIAVLEKELDEKSADALFSECEAWLLRTVPGESSGTDCISSDLVLPSEWSERGVMLAWESSDPALAGESGEVDLWSAEDGDKVTLYCTMLARGFSRQLEIGLTLMPSLAGFEQRAASAIRKEAARLSEAAEGDALVLAAENSPVSWSRSEEKNTGALVLVMLLLVLSVWTSRFSSLKNELKSRAASFEEELIDMTSQLVLYLEAGLVCSSALRQLTEQNPPSKGQLFKAVNDLEDESASSNSPFTSLLYNYAISSANRDFIRIAAIIRENSDHGSELAEKLKRENARIRDARLSGAKGKAKETETKLCLPLMLLLVSLLLISAGPVFIGL